MTKQKVLIVDDTAQNIHVLMETLKDTYAIVAATNGAKALQLANREPRPDLILLDVMMPEMSGYEVCQHLKSDPLTAKIPVIFVTALHEAGDEEKGLELGAVDFITKPFHPALVKARIRNQLELKLHRDYLEVEVERRTQELLSSNLARQKLENELDVARSLQLSMLPSRELKLAGHADTLLASLLKPARAVGGDLYDYMMLGPDKLMVVVGDVSDKGVVAALFMVRVLTLLRSHAPNTASPSTLLALINQALCKDNDTFMFVTLSCFIIQLDTLEWVYASGGHEEPLLVESGQASFIEFESGPALGLMEEAEYLDYRGRLAPGSTMVFYTDGITEAENSAQEFYGTDRLLSEAAMACAGETSPQHVTQSLADSVGQFAETAEQSDDLTLVVFKAPGVSK